MRHTLSWSLYWLCCMFDDMRRFPLIGRLCYGPYSWFLRASNAVQGTSGRGPWAALRECELAYSTAQGGSDRE